MKKFKLLLLSTTLALAGLGAQVQAEDEIYIPVISKGFQHQFWLALYCTDDWGAYERLLPEDQHLITKRYTQRIERQNLNLRTWIKRLARKTICFSKSIELHDKVIGTCIERRFFNSFKS